MLGLWDAMPHGQRSWTVRLPTHGVDPLMLTDSSLRLGLPGEAVVPPVAYPS